MLGVVRCLLGVLLGVKCLIVIDFFEMLGVGAFFKLCLYTEYLKLAYKMA